MMTLISVRLTVTDIDGCTYSRDYVDTPNWFDSLGELSRMTVGAYPSLTGATVGNGAGNGRLINPADGTDAGAWSVATL